MSASLPSTLPSGHRGAAVWTLALVLVVSAWLGGCASGPRAGAAPTSGRDGAEANPPKGLLAVPDAEPRVEAVRTGGPNRPYEVFGRRYVPFTQDRTFTERGLASWYGRKFHGRRTASGEPYDMYAMTAAHPTLPLPSYARVRNPANGREVVVRVNDRGPFHPGRIIDLSYTAALKLDLLRGVAPVEVERITLQAIRSGSWRRDAAEASTRVPTEPVETQPDASGAMVVTQPTEAAPRPALSLPIAEPVVPAPIPQPAPAPGATGDPLPLPEVARANGFWVQLGAFRQRDGAEDFQRRVAAELDWPLERLAVFNDAELFRLQAGPYASREEARGAAERIRSSLQLVPVVLERR